MSGLSTGALGVGLLTADEAWAAVEERANRFGIVPGTLVDSEGHPIDRASIGTEPFIGEVMLVGFNFAPRGWALCQGQLLPISSNTALFFSLGNDLWRERAHDVWTAGSSRPGSIELRLRARAVATAIGAAEQVALTNVNQIPSHTHNTTLADESPSPTNANYPGILNTGANPAEQVATSATGGGQAHANMPPFLVLNYCLALVGVFPSRN